MVLRRYKLLKLLQLYSHMNNNGSSYNYEKKSDP